MTPLPAARDDRYRALATDFDGTIAHDGAVHENTLRALGRLKAAGFRILLITGRELTSLVSIFPEIDRFDLVVLEDGAVIYDPMTHSTEVLAKPPPAKFVARLYERGLPLHIGQVIVATWEPHEKVVLEEIKNFGLELQVIFNKGAVMILPSGINKAAGLRVASEKLGVDLREFVGVGDAENDHAFLEICGLSVAVANALAPIREKAKLVTQGDHGDGVIELVDRLLTAPESIP
jgi:hydroxymethylpyrimidine pyrophosphatase-like HAD family hydrolase